MYSIILSLCLFGQVPEERVKLYSFHADWCPPCQRMEKTTFKNKTVIKKIKDNFDFESIDTDVDRDLTNKYRITSIPTQLFIYKNRVVGRVVGFRNSVDLIREMDKILSEVKNE
jgi:thiol-disulfide isomerase/thioredoxin